MNENEIYKAMWVEYMSKVARKAKTEKHKMQYGAEFATEAILEMTELQIKYMLED